LTYLPEGSKPFLARVAFMLAMRSKFGSFLLELELKLPKPPSVTTDGGGMFAEIDIKNLL